MTWLRRILRRPHQAVYAVPDSPKMLRETLCVAQAGILELKRKGYKSAGASMDSHMERLTRLILECDRHRPLGRDGKHGNLHTPTCGCNR
jgi:hypothetical protein